MTLCLNQSHAVKDIPINVKKAMLQLIANGHLASIEAELQLTKHRWGVDDVTGAGKGHSSGSR